MLGPDIMRVARLRMNRPDLISIENYKMPTAVVERVIAFGHTPKIQHLTPWKTAITVMVAQGVIARPFEALPNLKESTVFCRRTAKVAKLENEFRSIAIDAFDKHPQPLIGIMHNILMRIGAEAELDRLERRPLRRSEVPIDHQRNARQRRAREELPAGDARGLHKLTIVSSGPPRKQVANR